MGHEAIGAVEAVGEDVRTLKPADLVLMPFAYSDGTCVFCHEGFIPRAFTAGSSVPGARPTERRRRRFASPWRTARSSGCRSARTTSSWPPFSGSPT